MTPAEMREMAAKSIAAMVIEWRWVMTFRRAKGIVYVILGVISPFLLRDIPIAAAIQTAMLIGLGAALIVRGGEPT